MVATLPADRTTLKSVYVNRPPGASVTSKSKVCRSLPGVAVPGPMAPRPVRWVPVVDCADAGPPGPPRPGLTGSRQPAAISAAARRAERPGSPPTSLPMCIVEPSRLERFATDHRRTLCAVSISQARWRGAMWHSGILGRCSRYRGGSATPVAGARQCLSAGSATRAASGENRTAGYDPAGRRGARAPRSRTAGRRRSVDRPLA